MDQNNVGDSKRCHHCLKLFFDSSTKNRHVKNVHKETVQPVKRQSWIICPLCQEQCGNYNNLRIHLEGYHKVVIDELSLTFCRKENFWEWFKGAKVDVNYAISRTKRYDGYTVVYYFCNRSNAFGSKSNCTKRTEKFGGSIRIKGVCPSHLIVKMYENGEINITFWKTHVGHKEEIRSQHLSQDEKKIVLAKLEGGVTVNRILQDARKVECNKLERINMLNRADITYISRKNNIEKRKHNNTMIAVALKVQEWNENGKNFAFLFKPIGEDHPVLCREDFAVAFMNVTMESKLKDFGRIICMDGTHCTNKKGIELTVILIKDDKNMGFPVAFLVSNRQDQLVQEVFLDSLKKRIGSTIKPEYFMTDDDPKYYNAWLKVIGTTPRRLLCTWHVVKNWNIQGKAKIKDLQMKKTMKSEMKKILNEINEEKFIEKTNKYFEKLQKANEVNFLNYLKKYYFQNQDRIKMWAHCHRVNAGINTNMAIESLNNMLKTNQLGRRANVTIDKLLDEIENLVELKMWQRILNIKRPNANNYHDKIIIKAHKTAEKMNKEDIKETGFGEFQVKSSSGSKFYKVLYNNICELECKTLYCRVCKICIHRYTCECEQYCVKTTIYDFAQMITEENSSKIENIHCKEIQEFIEEKQNVNEAQTQNAEDKRQLLVETFGQFLNNLEDESLDSFSIKFGALMEEYNRSRTKKRKMEKQTYYPAKRMH